MLVLQGNSSFKLLSYSPAPLAESG